MNGIKKEYEEWGRFVDDIKRKKIEEVFYTIKAVKPQPRIDENGIPEKGVVAIYAIFSASQKSVKPDEKEIMYFYLHTSFVYEFPEDAPTDTVMKTINPLIDNQFIKDLQMISVPLIIKGQVHEV